MRTQEFQDEPNYEVGQEQLDAVDRMLEELDLDEEFDRVPAAFRIVERFEQQQQQQQQLSRTPLDGDIENTTSSLNGHGQHSYMNMDPHHTTSDQAESDSDDPEPFGYIPLNQGYSNDSDHDDNDEDDYGNDGAEGYDQMQSDDEADHTVKGEKNTEGEDEEDDDDGQGYDGYLRSTNRDGATPVPVIPAPVQIELEVDERATEQIPEDDLKTIAKVMSSFSLPAPDWAKSIPEERWLPKIVQQAESSSTDKVGHRD
ncbi:hypothetical protein BGX27_002321 [Mortierella sp. AM989]|nr:hypothetical protein BGX27_002321 [Mortierella sp. AM989]